MKRTHSDIQLFSHHPWIPQPRVRLQKCSLPDFSEGMPFETRVQLEIVITFRHFDVNRTATFFFFSRQKMKEGNQCTQKSKLCERVLTRILAQGTKSAYLWSPSTSYVGGMSPSAPYACAQTEQGCCNCPCRGACQNGAPPHAPRLLGSPAHQNCLLSGLKKEVVSPDMRPPTSMPKTTRRALLRGPHKFGVCSFFPATSSLQHHPITVLRNLCVGIRRNGVHSPLWRPLPTDTPKQRKAVHDNLQLAAIHPVNVTKIQIADHHMGADSPTRLPARF